VGWKNFSSFGCEGLACGLGQPNVLKCAAGKKKLKMRVGKNFKNTWVGFDGRKSQFRIVKFSCPKVSLEVVSLLVSMSA